MKIYTAPILAMMLLTLFCPAAPESRNSCRIFFLVSYHLSDPDTEQFVTRLQTRLKELPCDVDINVFELDALRAPNRKIWHNRIIRYLSDSASVNYNLVVTLDDEALDTYLENAPDPDKIPVVFAGCENYIPEIKAKHPNVTGLIRQVPIRETIELGRKLFPEVNRAIVLSDKTETSRKIEAKLRSEFAAASGFPVEFINNSNLTPAMIAEHLRRLPDRDFLLILPKWRDFSIYQSYTSRSIGARLSLNLKRPFFSTSCDLLGAGMLGGYLTDPKTHADETFELIKRVLKPGSSVDIPIQTGSARPVIDYRKFSECDIDETLLPENVTFVNSPPSLWNQYRRAIITAIMAVLLSLTAIISFFASQLSMTRRYRSIMHSLPLNIVIVRRNEDISFAHFDAVEHRNPKYEKTLSQLAGDNPVLLEAVRRVLTTGHREVLDSGNYTHVISPIFESSDDPAAATWMSYDSREAQQLRGEVERLEQANRVSLEKIRIISRLAKLSFFESNFGANYTNYNPEISYRPIAPDGTPLPIDQWIRPDDLARLRHEAELVKSGRKQELRFKFRDLGSPPKTFQLIASRVGTQETPKLLGMLQDITGDEAMRREKLLTESLYKVLLDNLSVGIAVKDATNNFKFIQVNKMYCSMMNMPEEAMLNKSNLELGIDSGLATRFQTEDETVLNSGNPLRSSEKITWNNGARLLCEKTKMLVEVPSGEKLIVITLADTSRFYDLLSNERIINNALSQLAVEPDFGRNLNCILTLIRKNIHCSDIGLMIFDEESGRYLPLTEPGGYRVPVPEADMDAALSECHSELSCNRLLAISDISQRPGIRKLAESGVKSLILTPIFINESIYGVLTVSFKDQQFNFDNATKRMMHSLAYIISLAKIRGDHISSLNRALQEAQDANKAKSYFIASVSHEIRTPLNSVIGFAQLLGDNTLENSVRKEYLDCIYRSGNALLQLINDILDLSKLESEQMPIVNAPMDFNALCREIISVFRIKTQSKNLFLELKGEVPPILVADKLRLRQILFNLIGNAVKFTHRGGITVEIEFAVGDNSTGVLTFRVRDSGCGISREDQKNLFNPFVQVSVFHNPSDAAQGTGLGLAISRRMVDNMGGTLTLKSRPEHGSVFQVVLPGISYDNSPLASEATEDISWPRADFSGRNILLVDDIQLNLKVLGAMLRKLNATVAEASSGPEALELIKSGDFDAVMTDLWMPDMSGVELAAEIHRIPGCEALPVVVISADIDGTKNLDGSVFQGGLSKPVTLEQLSKLDLWPEAKVQ